jgi:hypothetical protein
LMFETSHCLKETALRARKHQEVIFIWTCHVALLIIFSNWTKVSLVNMHHGSEIFLVVVINPEKWKQLFWNRTSVCLILNLSLNFLDVLLVFLGQ